MKINRTQDASGTWSYNSPDEAAFVLCAFPEFYVSNIDDFIEGRQKVIRNDAHGDQVEGENVVLGEEVIAHLLEIRGEALAAYRAGDFPLMLAKLGQLEAQCNWRGLAFAARPEVALAEKTRKAKSKSGGGGRSMKIDGEKLSRKSIIKRLAIERDELNWVPPGNLWEPFKAAIAEQGFLVTEATKRKEITRRGKPSFEDERFIKIQLQSGMKMKTYTYTQFSSNLRDARTKLKL